MSKWLKKGDKVLVVAGNDKGSTGTVLFKKGSRVVVQGVNIRKKHVKRRTEAQRSEVISFEAPIHISNVRICNEENKPIRLKVRVKDGSKELYYLDGDKEKVYRQLKKNS